MLKAYTQLMDMLEERASLYLFQEVYGKNYSFLQCSNDLEESLVPRLCTSAVLLNWMVGRASGALPHSASLAEAELWYCEENGAVLSDLLSEEEQDVVLSHLRELDYGCEFLDILPYATEVFETADELFHPRGEKKRSKRNAGIYYTPSDVADYMVGFLYSKHRENCLLDPAPTWLDPACGTGVFLLSVLHFEAERDRLSPGKDALDYVRSCCYGLDISPLALQSATYVLVYTALQEKLSSTFSLKDSLYLIGPNLALCDSTKLRGVADINRMFPHLPLGPNIVVSNPPYVTTKGVGATQNARSTGNLFLEFGTLLEKLTHQKGVGGMVVPLSVTYNSQRSFVDFRDIVWDHGGQWWFANFDRTPDSLFGDDVKTRNTIVFYAKTPESKGQVYSTYLTRWSIKERSELFHRLEYVAVKPPSLNNIIPKVGDAVGISILERFNSNGSTFRLKEDMKPTRKPAVNPSRLLRNVKTAYNWIPVELIPETTTTDLNSSRYQYWVTQTYENTILIFALLNSRFIYWYWRVLGDGFHLNNSFLESIPFSTKMFSDRHKRQLIQFGQNLWKEMTQRPVISKNAGISTVSYCPHYSDDILDQIDALLVEAASLPSNSEQYVRLFTERTIVAGRNNLMLRPAFEYLEVKRNEY